MAITPKAPATAAPAGIAAILQKARGLMAANQPMAARKLLKETLQAHPRNLDLLVNYLSLLHALGESDALIGQSNDVVKARGVPALMMASILELRALSFLRLKQIDAACDALNAALKLVPENPKLLSHLAGILVSTHQDFEALAVMRRSLAISPNNPQILVNMSHALRNLNRSEEALSHALKASELAIQDDNIKLSLATVFSDLGKFEQSNRMAQEVLRNNRLQPRALAILVEAERDDPGKYADVLEQALQVQGLLPNQRKALLFAKANMLLKMKQDDKAFETLRLAHKAVDYQFDYARHRGIQEMLMRTYTREFFAERKDFGLAEARPIFIVGMPRSGTTLLEQMLGNHPQVFGAGELSYMVRQEGLMISQADDLERVSSELTSLSREAVKKHAEEAWSNMQRHSPSHSFILDKLPHNFLRVGLIRLLFPNAKIIHAIRDPLDVSLSIYQLPMSEGHAYSNELDSFGRYLNDYTRIMEHWYGVFGDGIYPHVYEAFVADPEQGMRKLLNHLQLPWDDRCLQTDNEGRSVKTFSKAQVRAPVTTTAVQKWRRYEKQLRPLIDQAGPAITFHASKLAASMK